MLLIIDNYDSFVFNLARYFQRLGWSTQVVRNDAIDAAEVRRRRPAAVVLSPGPCGPEQAGGSLAIVRQLHREVPMLGVCLGHQTIAAAFGARIVRAPQPMHGRPAPITHTGTGLFAGIPSPLTVGRYHSLAVATDALPACLETTATDAHGVVMALRHRSWPVFGVQFHPESVLTECGYQLLANFLGQAGQPPRRLAVPRLADELCLPPPRPARVPPQPVTF